MTNIRLIIIYSTVVTSQVAERIKEIYPFYKKCGWNYQQYIACLEPFGEKPGTKPYSLSSKQYGKFLSNLFELWYHDLQSASQPYIRQFENYVGLAAGYMQNLVSKGDAAEYSMQWKQMEAYIRVIFT